RLGEIEAGTGNNSEARRHLEAAIQIIESARAHAAGAAFRSTYTASQRVFYESYLDVLMQTPPAGVFRKLDVLALEASERSRMQSLVELLTEAKINIREGADSQLLNKEDSLLRQISAKEHNLISAAGDSRKVQSLSDTEKELDALLLQYQE